MIVQLKIMLLQFKKYILWILFSIILLAFGLISIDYYRSISIDYTIYLELLMGIIDVKKYNIIFRLLIIYDYLLISIINISFIFYERNSIPFLVRIKSKKLNFKKIIISLLFTLLYFIIKDIVINYFYNFSLTYNEILNKYVYISFIIISLYAFFALLKNKKYIFVYYIIIILPYIFYNRIVLIIISLMQLVYLYKKNYY